jgi:hypothetical protein
MGSRASPRQIALSRLAVLPDSVDRRRCRDLISVPVLEGGDALPAYSTPPGLRSP